MLQRALVLLVMVSADAASAQPARLTPTCLLDSAGTSATVDITNNDTRAVHAWVVEASLFEAGGAVRRLERRRDDVLHVVNPSRWVRVLSAGGTDSRRFRLDGKTTACSAEVTLAIFDDGTYVGNTTKLREVLDQRREDASEAARLLATVGDPRSQSYASEVTSASASSQASLAKYVRNRLASILPASDAASYTAKVAALHMDLLDYATLSKHLSLPRPALERGWPEGYCTRRFSQQWWGAWHLCY